MAWNAPRYGSPRPRRSPWRARKWTHQGRGVGKATCYPTTLSARGSKRLDRSPRFATVARWYWKSNRRRARDASNEYVRTVLSVLKFWCRLTRICSSFRAVVSESNEVAILQRLEVTGGKSTGPRSSSGMGIKGECQPAVSE